MISARKRILFVDDDPNVLSGLQRVLRSMREEWEMSFVTDPAQALQSVAAGECDLLVSDQHMPGMNGEQLLEAVQECAPETIRILLSGRSERDVLVGSLACAHQFVTKPCDPVELKSAIQRAFGLRDLLSDQRLARITSRVQSLPTLPALYLEVQELLRSDNAPLDEVGKLIAKDLGMTAKVLQLVNSAFFGLARRISDPSEAVSYLGVDTVRSLILSSKLFGHFEESSFKPATLQRIWEHSMAVASLARSIVHAEGGAPELEEQAFLAGMLHESGELVLAANLRDELTRAWQLSARFGLPVCEAERRFLGASHAVVGAYLLALWGLPDPVVEAIAYGHDPHVLELPGFSLVTALHVADALITAERGDPFGAIGVELDVEHVDRLGMGPRLDEWRTLCSSMLEEAP